MHAAVRRALQDLDAAGQPINISRVAAKAGVSRQWLYDSEYRTEIEKLRTLHPVLNSRPARERATEASLRAQLDTLRTRLTELRADNADLRRELERALGMLRERGT